MFSGFPSARPELSPFRESSLGLYLSVPFCRSKCTFCNFASGVGTPEELDRYVDRLVEDIHAAPAEAARQRLCLPRMVDSVYLGGGTPSLLTSVHFARIFKAIREHFAVLPGAEVTLEAAPAFLPDELLLAAQIHGVSRVSFGVQSFVDAEARSVGRLHTRDEAVRDLCRAQAAGLSTGVDLIAGLPGQTEQSWRESLRVLRTEAKPDHASVYMLEVDEDSRLGSEMLLGGTRYGAALTPSDDAVADFYEEACRELQAEGLALYEISNFARPGAESRHNSRYWERQPYLGLGLDASSMLRTEDEQAVRFGTTDDLPAWMGREGAHLWEGMDALSPAEELEEAWFLGLRRAGGVSLPALVYEFGPEAVAPFAPVLRELEESGLLRLTPQVARLTARGRLLANEVFGRLLEVTAATPELALR
jgi:oxygen-independent coproporphyrinogen III oxidase